MSCGILILFHMKLLQLLLKRRIKVKKPETIDSYQEVLNKQGSEQLRRLVERGLSIPIAVR